MNKRFYAIYAVMFAAMVWAFVGQFSVNSQTTNVLNEGFETGGKTSYAAANVTLGSGVWNLSDALTGSLTTDHKAGSFAARVQNTGKITMKFDLASTGTITVKHAVFSSDGTSTWELWKSTNQGAAWTKVGSTITTSSATVQTATFTVNYQGSLRFEIRKISGGTNRINIDDIVATNYVAPTPTPTPTPTATPTPTPVVSVHLTMGNPSNAATDVNQPTNYLMLKNQFVLSYNRDKAIPNWTSWHLDSSWIGSTARQDSFRNDTALPAGWYQVLGTSYSGSGYDRGHMCPSGDRTATVADNDATFLMTNMIPQAPNNNQGPWAALESYCRTLVTAGNELYIISGGFGTSGFIDNGHITVPTSTWKVIIVLPSGTNDVSRVTSATRTIAVNMPNQQGLDTNWRNHRTSIDAIESLTGFDFFSGVPTTIQAQIESVVDTQFVSDDDGTRVDKVGYEENLASSSDIIPIIKPIWKVR